MRIFIAGATGAIGKRLVPMLAAAGHRVFGTSRSPARASLIAELGAEPLIVDALDRAAVSDAVRRCSPDVIVHELTAIPPGLDLRRFSEQFAATNRLRTIGTDNLLAAGRESGVRRFVAQSFAGWRFAREGGLVKSEDEPFDPRPPRQLETTLQAMQYLESAVLSAPLEGIVLRYGGLYGPGTSLDHDGAMTEAIRHRAFPVIGAGAGVWSWLHIDDAASSTVLAVEEGATGIFNIVDDHPAAVAEWLPALAAMAGAKPPRKIPTWLGRLLAGELAVHLMNNVRGASNRKAKKELGWSPRWPDWRTGFEHVLTKRGDVTELRKSA